MDLISRHDAIKVVRKWFDKMRLNGGFCIDGIISLPSAQTDLIATIQNGIKATNANDSYSCGMRNGMRWCMSLVDDKEPLFENCTSAQPERLTDDDFEAIRIHLNAYKEKLCNQHGWKEAEEYQRIINRFMSFASAQPKIVRCRECKHCEHWYADRGRCFLWHEDGISVFEDGFCNYAERKTDD